MSSTTNKLRQVFNLFLLLLLVSTITGVFVWLLTTPEDRGTTFWLSMGFLAFAALLGTLLASRIALRGNRGAEIPHGFSHLYLLVLYFVFVIVMAIANVWVGFSVTTYFLIHVGGVGVFLIPLLMSNMAMLRLSGDDRKAVRRGGYVLKDHATQVEALLQDLRGNEESVDDLRASLKRLAESLRYSDPTPGPEETEIELSQAINRLTQAFQTLATVSEDGQASSQIKPQEACTLAERALAARNETVLRTK